MLIILKKKLRKRLTLLVKAEHLELNFTFLPLHNKTLDVTGKTFAIRCNTMGSGG